MTVSVMHPSGFPTYQVVDPGPYLSVGWTIEPGDNEAPDEAPPDEAE